jgi:hypothetical protein
VLSTVWTKTAGIAIDGTIVMLDVLILVMRYECIFIKESFAVGPEILTTSLIVVPTVLDVEIITVFGCFMLLPGGVIVVGLRA